MAAYCVLMTSKVTDHQYDLKVKDQGQIYHTQICLKALYAISFLSFLKEYIHIKHNDCL